MSSEITPENAHLYAQNAASCGAVNTLTGEFREGVTDAKGNLTYRDPLPWWKRLFGRKVKVELWSEWQYQTTIEGKQTMLSGGLFSKTEYQEWDTSVHIYRQTHRYTGARRYYAKTGMGFGYHIDADVYERTGRVVTV